MCILKVQFYVQLYCILYVIPLRFFHKVLQLTLICLQITLFLLRGFPSFFQFTEIVEKWVTYFLGMTGSRQQRL
jgi:hypothetical protein